MLRSARSSATLQVQVSPVEPRRSSSWSARGSVEGQDTSTPVRPQNSTYDSNLYPPPYYPPSPWSPPYQPWPMPYQYPYYPSSPVSPITLKESTPTTMWGASTLPRANAPQLCETTPPSNRSRNQLLATPSGSQESVDSRAGRNMSLLLDESVNLASPRWDLSPIIVEAVSSAGGVDSASLHSYLDRSANNFQELVRQNPEPMVLEEALAGAGLEMQVSQNDFKYLMQKFRQNLVSLLLESKLIKLLLI